MNDKMMQSQNFACWRAFEVHAANVRANALNAHEIKNIKYNLKLIAETLEAVLYLMKNKQKEQKKPAKQ